MHSPVRTMSDQAEAFPRLRDLRHMQAQAELDQRRAKTAAEKVRPRYTDDMANRMSYVPSSAWVTVFP